MSETAIDTNYIDTYYVLESCYLLSGIDGVKQWKRRREFCQKLKVDVIVCGGLIWPQSLKAKEN
jgi:hypothetical protein